MRHKERFDSVSWLVLMLYLYYRDQATDRMVCPEWRKDCKTFGLRFDTLRTLHLILQRWGLIRVDQSGRYFRVMV